MAWCFGDEATGKTNDLLASRATNRRAYAPSLWPLEVVNVLLVSEQRKRIGRSDATRFIALLMSLPISIDVETTTPVIRSIIGLGRAHKISAYDASYLELAQRRSLPFATLDKRLKNVAKKLQISCLL
jgi:predicted nucleic acid-binding protein